MKWVEDTLIKHPDFALPGKKALIEKGSEDDLILIDVSETPIQRPKKAKVLLKEAHHKIPSCCKKTEQRIMCTSFAPGRKHDFRIFKESKVHLYPNAKSVEDSGYQGIQKLYANSETPKKRNKKNPLIKMTRKTTENYPEQGYT